MKAYHLRVILVEPSGSINLGFITRLIYNFDINELVLVNPKLGINDWEEAKIYASRAKKIINKIRIYNNLDEAIKDGDLIVATSAIYRLRGPNILRRPVNVNELVNIIRESGSRKIYIVFGRESTGLTNEEISKCDLLLSLETSKKYPTLNVSNAAAIVLYELFKELRKSEVIKREKAKKITKEKLLEYYNLILKSLTVDDIFYKRSFIAFKNVVNRGTPDKGEMTTLMKTFKKIYHRLISH